jgi:hypothetical protein
MAQEDLEDSHNDSRPTEQGTSVNAESTAEEEMDQT